MTTTNSVRHSHCHRSDNTSAQTLSDASSKISKHLANFETSTSLDKSHGYYPRIHHSKRTTTSLRTASLTSTQPVHPAANASHRNSPTIYPAKASFPPNRPQHLLTSVILSRQAPLDDTPVTQATTLPTLPHPTPTGHTIRPLENKVTFMQAKQSNTRIMNSPTHPPTACPPHRISLGMHTKWTTVIITPQLCVLTTATQPAPQLPRLADFSFSLVSATLIHGHNLCMIAGLSPRLNSKPRVVY